MFGRRLPSVEVVCLGEGFPGGAGGGVGHGREDVRRAADERRAVVWVSSSVATVWLSSRMTQSTRNTTYGDRHGVWGPAVQIGGRHDVCHEPSDF